MTLTVEQVKAEVMLLNPENITFFPIKNGKRDDFRSLWNRFGPQAGRDIMIPAIWHGECPLPSEFFKKDGTRR